MRFYTTQHQAFCVRFQNAADCPDTASYLELEFSPHGFYLCLQFRGQRNCVDSMIPLEFYAQIVGNRWTGCAIISNLYLPGGGSSCSNFLANAYAIHDRISESRLSTTSASCECDYNEDSRCYAAANFVHTTAPDFHQIAQFCEIANTFSR